ncbi:MAG: BACON domain-containing protein [Paludibacter sp.]|nr:BACON domain-containing protein [Paludibacter sp.]
MKKILILPFFPIIALFCSCNNEAADVITTSSDTLTVVALNGTRSLAINAPTTWSAKSSDSWCTLSDSTGQSSKSIRLTCQNNISGMPREAKILIRSNKQTKTVVVSQSCGTTLLDEGFANNSKSWTTQIDSVANAIGNGYFAIVNTAKYYAYFIGVKSLISEFTGSYIISTNYKIISGTAPFGLVFGAKDPQNFYRLLIFPLGGFTIYQVSNGVYTSIKNEATGFVNNENTIRIVKIQTNCSVYLNDHKIADFTYSTPYGPFVGFYSCPQTEVDVDYLRIHKF